jgi:hypothetical protein
MEGGRLVCEVAGALAREGWRRAAQRMWCYRQQLRELVLDLTGVGCAGFGPRAPASSRCTAGIRRRDCVVIAGPDRRSRTEPSARANDDHSDDAVCSSQLRPCGHDGLLLNRTVSSAKKRCRQHCNADAARRSSKRPSQRPGFAAPRTTNANGRRYGMGTERINRPSMLAVDNMGACRGNKPLRW